MRHDSPDKITLPINLFTELLDEARAQLGTARLIELIVGETEPRPKAKKPKPATQAKSKPTPKQPAKAKGKIKAEKKPPTQAELEAMILAVAQADGFVQAAEFYDWWAESERKKAKARVSAVLGKLVEDGKLVKEGHAQHTRYKPKKT